MIFNFEGVGTKDRPRFNKFSISFVTGKSLKLYTRDGTFFRASFFFNFSHVNQFMVGFCNPLESPHTSSQ